MSQLLLQYYYLASFVLFFIGFYTVITRKNLIKKIIGINVMDTAVFLFFISMGSVKNGTAPIVIFGKKAMYVNPLPQALVLTGIVVAVSTTGFGLALIAKIYEKYGTLDISKILEMKGEVE